MNNSALSRQLTNDEFVQKKGMTSDQSYFSENVENKLWMVVSNGKMLERKSACVYILYCTYILLSGSSF